MTTRPSTFIFIVIAVTISALSWQAAAAKDSPKDNFVGKWTLNVSKSSLPPESGAIVIESQGDNYKISVDVAYGNGSKLSFWTVTDMKGTVSKVTQSNGEPMNEEWRVTRESSDAFVVDSRPFPSVVRYTVSPDGMTLTRREVSSSIMGAKIENGAVKRQVPMFVYDKVN